MFVYATIFFCGSLLENAERSRKVCSEIKSMERTHACTKERGCLFKIKTDTRS